MNEKQKYRHMKYSIDFKIEKPRNADDAIRRALELKQLMDEVDHVSDRLRQSGNIHDLPDKRLIRAT